MRVSFVYEGHEIAISRDMFEMNMFIDDKIVDSVKGMFKSAGDCELHGKVKSANGIEKQVEVQFRSGGLREIHSRLNLMVDGQLIEVKNIL